MKQKENMEKLKIVSSAERLRNICLATAVVVIAFGLAILLSSAPATSQILIYGSLLGGLIFLILAASLASYTRGRTAGRAYVNREIASASRAVAASAEKTRADVEAELAVAVRESKELKSIFEAELAAEIKRVRNEHKRLLTATETRLIAEITKVKSGLSEQLRAAQPETVTDNSLEAIRASVLHQVFKVARIAGSCSGLFTREELDILSRRFDEYDCLTVHWLLASHDAFDVLPLSPRRKLSTDLRSIGYLAKSLEVFESVSALTGTERDRLALQARQSEMRVYRGEYRSKLLGGSEEIEAIPGTVLHVVAKALPAVQSGYTLRTHYTATAQCESGLRVAVVSQVGEASSTTEQESTNIDGVTYYTLPGQPKNLVPWEDWLDTNIAGLVSVVREVQPAVIHAHSDFFNAISAQQLGDYFGIPVVYESRGFWEESWLSRTAQRFGLDWEDLEERWGLPEAYLLRKEREQVARAEASHVFTLARVMQERIIKAGVSSQNIALVPNAVRAADFPVLGRDSELATKMGIADDCVTIGYVSSIVEYEGIDTLIEGFRLASKSVSHPVRLLIVGDGPALSGLQKQAAEAGMADVHFTGRVPHDDVLGYYGLIDIFVVPRRPVAVCHLVTPLKPFEAFSTGRTVVMSDVGALREIAEDSGAVELFTAGDAQSLAEVLVGLVEDEDRRAVLAERGASWVRNERSWKRNAQEYLQVYERMGLI